MEEEMPDYDHEAITEEKLINEEYKTWKKNAPYLYDLMLSTALEWPTLTTQWLPDKQSVPDKDHSTHRLLIGTHTSGSAQNYLEIAQVTLPNPVDADVRDFDEETGEIGGYGGGSASKKQPPNDVKFHIIQRIDHKGEVNKARYQPQNPNLIATWCTDSRVMIWDKSKHSVTPSGTVNPQMELHGHKAEGFGMNWSPHQAGHLATGSEDKTVRVWDLQAYTPSNKLLKPTRTFTHHSDIVNDVQYNPKIPALIGTVSDDLTLQVVDTRKSSDGSSVLKAADGHTDAINALSFNPASECILATGSNDKTVAIWDLRNLKVKLHSLQGHNDHVTSLDWHPFEQSILGSASGDRRVLFWDLSKVGEEQNPEDAEDGPPELLFMHGGHTNRISDFSWNPNDPWVMCSAAEDNLLQVWRIANAIVGKDADEPAVDDLEDYPLSFQFDIVDVPAGWQLVRRSSEDILLPVPGRVSASDAQLFSEELQYANENPEFFSGKPQYRPRTLWRHMPTPSRSPSPTTKIANYRLDELFDADNELSEDDSLGGL